MLMVPNFKPAKEIREDTYYPIQAEAKRCFRGSPDRATRIMENVPTLVASVTPVYTVEKDSNGVLQEKKIRDEAVVYVNRLHPRNL